MAPVAGGGADTGGSVCSPPALGAPCATGGTALPGNSEPGPGLGMGNPVHLATGNKYQLDVDLPPNPAAPALELIRHYNGLATQGTALGRNWAFSYDVRLRRRGDGWQVRQGDGSILKIAAPVPQGRELRWQWPDGRRLIFDAGGHLVRIELGRAAFVRIHRHAGPHPLAGMIRRVESSSGHTLRFHYREYEGQAALESVDTPLGSFRYRHGRPDPASGHRSPRLEAVERPDGMRRLYHYEAGFQSGNPYALTGISLGAPAGPDHRLATWKYDSHGRVIEAQQHGRRLPVLHFDYAQTARGNRAGLTRVRGSDGRQQEIRYQHVHGGYRLLSRQSGGCAQPASGAVAACPDTAAGPDTIAQYDAQGRLTALSGMLLRRSPGGGLTGLLRPPAPGWPGLAFDHDGPQGRYTWQSDATGPTTLLADSAGRPAHLRYANGDTVRLHYDAQGRPLRIDESAGDPARGATSTRLRWHGRQLLRIEHPAETESLQRDGGGRIVGRSVQRPGSGLSPAFRFREGFGYDDQGRLTLHRLPEGGALHYEWRGARLAALHWEDTQGQVQPVITSVAGTPGYRHGNGLERVAGAPAGLHADTLWLGHGGETWWLQRSSHDAAGRVLHDIHEFPPFGRHDRQYYVHDPQSRMRAALHQRAGSSARHWYAWHPDGRLAAMNEGGRSRIPSVRRDASGLPLRTGRHLLRYGPGRRLESVASAATGEPLAQYRHNAFGHRIIKYHGGQATHYLYLGNQLVAEARGDGGHAPPAVTRRFLHAGLTPVGMIEYPSGGPPRLLAVHADLSGAPRLVTDADRRLRWLASYTPTGQARQVAGDMHFPLRLPGQYEDPETGWHDNLLRTYVAGLGHYLEPDPLGPLPGTDAYGYARQQPWRYADPWGLLLFAFDGTRYNAQSMGNVWKLSQAYRDGAAHYHAGPGSSEYFDWDALVAWRAGRILENQWQALLAALEHQPPDTVTPIDIVGFSRGAALARHFGNRIATHVRDGMFSVADPLRGQISACVDLRFMGLFDTVAQFGIAGSHNHLYDFRIAELWSWVSHAVALHEHRWTFPLTSAEAGGSGNLVEAPFVGAHADIGGGLALRDPPSPQPGGPATDAKGGATAPDSDPAASGLADVALGWMHWQARAATVDFAALANAGPGAQAPRLHDMRSPLWRTIQDGDRAVQGPSGAIRWNYQDEDPRLGRARRAQTEAFIDRPEAWRSEPGDVVGRVDMEGYASWLEETLGWSPP
ncbi:DUF2235 domain-containing protein [Alcaligenaceae bacterium]|nr:DUF2235 domain-containing protein [Alcaligenaceae bacterium]